MKPKSIVKDRSSASSAHTVLHVGLDVHKSSISIALAFPNGEEPQFWRSISNDLHALEKAVVALRELSAELHFVYEAGPTGYVIARRLAQLGEDCIVVAPSKIPKASGNKVKTDKRDAQMLAGLHRAGQLKGINVPDSTDEALRDLARARTDVVEARRRCRQQLKSFLLRNGYCYQGKTAWTQAHMRYLRELVLGHPSQKIVLEESLQAIDAAGQRLARIDEQLLEQAKGWRMYPVVEALMTLRGFQFTAAVVVCSELGDLSRFENPRQLMAFLGLVGSENSTGNRVRQGSITKCGNPHARLFLVEAAQHYDKAPLVNKHLSRRQEGQPRRILEMSWEAQHRLNRRFNRLLARRMPRQKVVVAIARELCGFVWAISRETLAPGTILPRTPRTAIVPSAQTRNADRSKPSSREPHARPRANTGRVYTIKRPVYTTTHFPNR